MNLPSRITALLISVTREMIEAVPPAERHRLAVECQRVAALAAASEPPAAPREGVLKRLDDGERPP